MNPIQNWDFNGRNIRTTTGGQGDGDGELWWFADDVCATLTLMGDPGQHTRRLDLDEKGLITIQTPGGPQEKLIINESGLYSLIMTSRKPEAKAFKKWVTSVVLPAIRKTGRYEAAGDRAALTQALEELKARLTSQAQIIATFQGHVLAMEANHAKMAEMIEKLIKTRRKPLLFVPDGLHRPTEWWDKQGIKWRQIEKINRDDLWPSLYRLNAKMGGQKISCEIAGRRPAYYVEHRVLARHWKELSDKYDRLQDDMLFGPEDDSI